MFAAILLCKAVAIYSILISMLLVCVHSVADNSTKYYHTHAFGLA